MDVIILDKKSLLPIIAYVPPFSGLEPTEEFRDDGILRQQVGKAQPGSVLRNLLFRVWEKNQQEGGGDWDEIQRVIKQWFNVELNSPQYERGLDIKILCEYKPGNKSGDKSYDIISGGSGFHQALTLLAFFYGYKPTTILLDEPDAHLHVNLQREILGYFKNQQANQQATERNTQFLISTHGSEFIKGVDSRQIISLLDKKPKRIEAKPNIITAMADVSNLEVTQLSELAMPMLLYVEGETDIRLLSAWDNILNSQNKLLNQVCFHIMGGGNKNLMKEDSQRHFEGIQQIIPQAKRLVLFDFDNSKEAFHPKLDNPVLYEWRRKNIENYLLVADAWIRAALHKIGITKDQVFLIPIRDLITEFFVSENLTLPPGQFWRNVKANIFQVVDGKKLLFENENSLFQQLKAYENPLSTMKGIELTREAVAANMTPDEIHEDVYHFFDKLRQLLDDS